METKPQQEPQFCKKLAYGNSDNPSIILGIIINEVDNFLIFKTAKRVYTISKSAIISLENTNRPFIEVQP